MKADQIEGLSLLENSLDEATCYKCLSYKRIPAFFTVLFQVMHQLLRMRLPDGAQQVNVRVLRAVALDVV